MVINVKASIMRKYCHGLKAYSGIVTLIIASICVVTTKVLEATLASHPKVDIQPDAYERTVNRSAELRLRREMHRSYFFDIWVVQTPTSSGIALSRR